MAKSLRSKVKRHFRSCRRHTVAEAPQQLDAEQRRQELLQAAIDAPITTQQGLSSDIQQGDCAAASAQGEGPAEAMAVELPELTTKNPGKLARKLKARRLAAARGINPGKKKKAGPLAGANQFHKKKTKKSRH